MDLKSLLILLLLISIPFCDLTYAATPKASLEKNMLSENDKTNLLRYLDRVLVEAGIPDEPRAYIVARSRRALSKVTEKEYPEKKEILMRNLYILLIDLASKKPLLFSDSKLHFVQTKNEMSERFLSVDHLTYLRSQQVFEGLTVKDVKFIFETIPPLWPWHEGDE